ncbi:MAG: hypothetical protein K6A89_06340 [Treponema sp.]|nr:hypothetical protein [Treponema sp.]
MKFHGELLIFVMLLVTNLRVFFVRQVRRDPLVVLAPFTFILSILQILAWGIDIFSAFAFFLALLVLLSNFHAIFRYMESLYIDHYSALMKVWAVCTVSLSVLSIVVLIIFAPDESKSNKIGVQENIYRMEGSFRSGFKEAGSFKIADAFIYEFSVLPPINEKTQEEEKSILPDNTQVEENSTLPENTQTEEISALPENVQTEENLSDADQTIILFFPDKRGDTINYKPYLQQLALKGNLVYSADFYSNDCKWLHSFGDNKIFRRTILLIQNFVRPAFFVSQREYYSYNIKLEAEAMLKYVEEKFAKEDKLVTNAVSEAAVSEADEKLQAENISESEKISCIMICDAMGHSALSELQKQYPDLIKKIIFLDEIPEYKTAGYGMIEQTNPLLLTSLGMEKDSSRNISDILAEKTMEIINNESL